MSVRRQNKLMRACCCLSVCWKSFPSKLTTCPWWEWLPCLFHWWLRFGERCHMKPHLVSVWAQQKHTFVAMLYCPRLIILWNCNGIVSVVFVAPRCLNGERQPWAPQCKTRIKQIKICSFFSTSLSFKISMLYKNLQYTLKLKKMWGREKGGGRLPESRCVYMLIIVANWKADGTATWHLTRQKETSPFLKSSSSSSYWANPPPKIKHMLLRFVLTIFFTDISCLHCHQISTRCLIFPFEMVLTCLIVEASDAIVVWTRSLHRNTVLTLLNCILSNGCTQYNHLDLDQCWSRCVVSPLKTRIWIQMILVLNVLMHFSWVSVGHKVQFDV